MKTIESRQNPRVKQLVRLRERKHREKEGFFLVEGHFELSRAVGAGKRIDEIYFCRRYFRAEAYEEFLEKAAKDGAVLFEVSPEVFEKIAYRESPDGLVGVASVWDLNLAKLDLKNDPLILVAECVEKPGNLGSLIRTGSAAGVDAIILCDPGTDVFNPNVVRASRGLLFSQPIALAKPEEVLSFLKERSIRVLATTPEAERYHWDCDLKKSVAVIVGSEWAGLSDYWLEQADERVKLPMAGFGDSLNVGVAAAITLYEAVRQRDEELDKKK